MGNLQELVYKQGQAGVTKATVTINFNNSDKKGSPVGYEHFDQISVTRTVRQMSRRRLACGHEEMGCVLIDPFIADGCLIIYRW